MTSPSPDVFRLAAAVNVPLMIAVALGLAANVATDDHRLAFWLVVVIPTTAAVAGMAILARARLVLLHGVLGVIVAYLAGLSPAEAQNAAAPEPLLTDGGVALSWAVLGFLPVPFLAMGVWLARSIRSAEATG